MRETFYTAYTSVDPKTTLADLKTFVDGLCECNDPATLLQFELRITPEAARNWMAMKAAGSNDS